MSYDQKTRFGLSAPPAWMPPSTAQELMQRQQSYQAGGLPGMSLPLPVPAPMTMAMPMPVMMSVPYGYPAAPAQDSPDTRRRRANDHYSDSEGDDEYRRDSVRHRAHRSHHAVQKHGQRKRSHRSSKRRDSSGTSDGSRRRISLSRRAGRTSRRHRRRSPSKASSTDTTSGSTSSTTVSRRASTSSDSVSSSDDVSSTASGHSSGRETTLTTNEMLLASQQAASILAIPPKRSRQLNAPTPSPLGPERETPTGRDLFLEIQKAYRHYPQPDPKLKNRALDAATLRSTDMVDQTKTSRLASLSQATDTEDKSETFAQRILPRPKLSTFTERRAVPPLHPIGAETSSAFTRVGYRPVKTPQLPPSAHVGTHPVTALPPVLQSTYEDDPPVFSRSHPNSAQTSPNQALFPPLEYEVPNRATSLERLPRSQSRAMSTYSTRYAAPAPSQIQAAIQHRSVSEAAFPVGHNDIARPERAALSVAGSRLVSPNWLHGVTHWCGGNSHIHASADFPCFFGSFTSLWPAQVIPQQKSVKSKIPTLTRRL